MENIQYDGFDPNWRERAGASYPVIYKDVSGWGIIGEQVCNIAKEIYKECGAEDDYCIQDNASYGTVVFGSVNRVHWTFATGFTIQGSCTKEFKENFAPVVSNMEEFY